MTRRARRRWRVRCNRAIRNYHRAGNLAGKHRLYSADPIHWTSGLRAYSHRVIDAHGPDDGALWLGRGPLWDWFCLREWIVAWGDCRVYTRGRSLRLLRKGWKTLRA